MPGRKPRHAKSSSAAEKSVLKALAGENVDQLLATLSTEERALFDKVVEEIRGGGESAYLNELWRYDYLRKPPSIEEFIKDPYWMGNVTQPSEENVGIWPTWNNILKADFDLDSRIHNTVITGSLGIGKTTIAVLIILYRLALASLLRNPHNFLGLQRASKIIYVLMSVTLAQVKDTAFGMAMNNMALSPYFTEELGFDANSKYSGGVVNLKGEFQLNGGSKPQHILGRNVPAILMDEGNFRLEQNPNEKAYKLFHEVRTRLKNRFQKTAGFLPAISIIASSASDESSFTETVITEINNKNDPKTEKVYSNPVYYMKNYRIWIDMGVNPDFARQHANIYKKRWFKVAHGLKSVAPSILKGWYTELGKKIDRPETYEEPPKGSRTELVPEDYLDEYERDTIGSLQALSGISIGGSYRLFTSMVDIEWCILAGERAGVVDPRTIPVIHLSEEDDREIWDFLEHSRFLTRQAGSVVPKRHPAELRYAHIDHATRTFAGLAVCHQVGYSNVQNLVDKLSGRVFGEHRLVVEYDFILTITAGRVKPISFEKIQKFFIWLRDRCGYQFGKITSDTFQSFMQLQMLETRGFPTDTLSLDKTKAPYFEWRSGFEEHRILTYRQERMVQEAEMLIDGPKKVDHPETTSTTGGITKGTKDVCLSGFTEVHDMKIGPVKLMHIPRGQVFTVPAYDIANCQYVIAEATSLGVTGEQRQVVRVYLSNQNDIVCTPDHKILTESGFKAATDLRPGESLIPSFKVAPLTVVGVTDCLFTEDVYCLRVPEFGNFGIVNGPVVSNCDSAAGAYYDCVTSGATSTEAFANVPVITSNEEPIAPEDPIIHIDVPPYRRTVKRFESK